MNDRPKTLPDTDLLEPDQTGLQAPQRIAVSPGGMIATQHHLATDAGAKVLREGGNAVDAAVTAAWALCVCEPAASGLGGQTMMLIHLAGKKRPFALDGSSRAPNLTGAVPLSREDRRRGYKAATVPSTPAVLGYALRRYGSFPISRVISPAVELARRGYKISELQRRLTRRESMHLKEHGAAGLFLKKGRRSYRAGELFCQPALAQTLRRLALRGVENFYLGRIAGQIHRDMIDHGGLIRREDLAQIPWPIKRPAVKCRFENMTVFTFPPPGAGRTLIEMLNVLDHFPAARRDPDTPRGALLLARVIRQAFRDRRDRPYEPNFYAQVSKRKMLSGDYAGQLAQRFRRPLRTGGETTHLSVMDRYGNAVSLTQSIDGVYGACAAAPKLGFLYNSYMTAFEDSDIRHPYYLRPNASPWASVAPTIAFRKRKPWLVIGSPGSERIVSSILQVLLRLKGHSPFEAVDAPRLHCSFDGVVSLEGSRMRDDIRQHLSSAGFEVEVRHPYSFYLGCVQLVIRQGEVFTGVADPRRDGSAAG
jgi:gamma-glutamyltranspeptidase/glutathione hydrolase